MIKLNCINTVSENVNKFCETISEPNEIEYENYIVYNVSNVKSTKWHFVTCWRISFIFAAFEF